jgi:hypothetical protein
MYWFKKEQFHTYQETTNGVFGLFDTPDEILEAAEKTKEKKYTGFDCLTPFPVHGLDEAMGLPRSGIPWVSFFMGLVGCTFGFASIPYSCCRLADKLFWKSIQCMACLHSSNL